jgi:hypothetical protein
MWHSTIIEKPHLILLSCTNWAGSSQVIQGICGVGFVFSYSSQLWNAHCLSCLVLLPPYFFGVGSRAQEFCPGLKPWKLRSDCLQRMALSYYLRFCLFILTELDPVICFSFINVAKVRKHPFCIKLRKTLTSILVVDFLFCWLWWSKLPLWSKWIIWQRIEGNFHSRTESYQQPQRSLEADPVPMEPWDDCEPALKKLDCGFVKKKWRRQFTHTWLIETWYKKMCCHKLLSFRIICYTEIDKWSIALAIYSFIQGFWETFCVINL